MPMALWRRDVNAIIKWRLDCDHRIMVRGLVCSADSGSSIPTTAGYPKAVEGAWHSYTME